MPASRQPLRAAGEVNLSLAAFFIDEKKGPVPRFGIAQPRGRGDRWTGGPRQGKTLSGAIAGRVSGIDMKQFFLKLFTWWNRETFGTQLTTWLYGERVGEDHLGNVYYRTKGGKLDPALGIERRWVIYAGEAEGSMIPEGWNGWLHHTVDVPPSQESYTPREWQKPHQPNLTGTPFAYRPKGSVLREGVRQPATGDYDAWSPGE